MLGVEVAVHAVGVRDGGDFVGRAGGGAAVRRARHTSAG